MGRSMAAWLMGRWFGFLAGRLAMAGGGLHDGCGYGLWKAGVLFVFEDARRAGVVSLAVPDEVGSVGSGCRLWACVSDATSEATSSSGASLHQPGSHQARAVKSTGKKVGVPPGVAFFGVPVLLTVRDGLRQPTMGGKGCRPPASTQRPALPRSAPTSILLGGIPSASAAGAFGFSVLEGFG